MSKSIEITAKTVDDAIEKAVSELNLDRSSIKVKVIDSGSKGIFGIGAKDAVVRVTADVNLEERAKTFLDDVFFAMGMKVDFDIKREGKVMKINLIGDNLGIIIGKRGDTLDSLEHLTNLCVNKGDVDYVKVILDVENYRARREQTLIKLAKNLASTVVRTGKKITLEPMHSNERRIIHAILQSHSEVETYSVGEEPNRKVVIALKKK
ncbi:MAG: protein jag [Clostridia bacterium]|nr:protein jag [Clostridia bacterium]